MGDFGVIRAGHIDDYGGVCRDGNSGEGAGVVRTRESGKENAGSEAAIGERDLCSGGGGEGCRDARNDFKKNFVGAESLDFFGGAAKEERVAPFEADDNRMLRGGVDEERVDVGLREETEAGALADVDTLCGGRDEGEDFGADEGIVEDNVGGLKQARGLPGEEIGIARASTD